MDTQAIRERVRQQSVDQQSSEANDATQSQMRALIQTVISANQLLIGYLNRAELKVTVTNPTKAITSVATPDVARVVDAVQQLEMTVQNKTDDDSGVIAAIQSLLPELKAIPKSIQFPEMPEGIEEVTIKNLDEVTMPLEHSLAELHAAISSLKLDPTINVAPPTVNVPEIKLDVLLTALGKVEKAVGSIKMPTMPDPVDLKPLITTQKATTKAIESLRFPVSSTPTDPLIKYTPADIDDAGAVQYFGFTDNSGAWYIRKFDTGASPKTIRFAFGQGAYATNWTGRTGLTYSIYGT